MTRYRVQHRTTYDYGQAVVASHNEARLSPRRLERQSIAETAFEIEPRPDTVARHRDYFGNEVTFFNLHTPHTQLVVVASSDVTVARTALVKPSSTVSWQFLADAFSSNAAGSQDAVPLDALQFVFDSTLVPRTEALARYARPSFSPGRPILEGVLDLNHRLFCDFEYDPTATTVATPVEEVLASRRGVCQDFSHLMIGCLRSLGLPARYTSGYVAPKRRGTPSGSGPSLIGAHASHAWVGVYCGEAGWVEVDPTNDLVVSDQHVVLAWGRDFEDVTPIKGVTLGGGVHEVKVEVVVEPTAGSGSSVDD